MKKSPTILVVDDEPYNLDLVCQELDTIGVETVTAGSGQDALDVLDAQRCDVMLLDIMMPGMSGYDVLQWLRDDGRLTNLPVIVISALDDLESVVRCIEMGAEDYLTKPFDPVLLKARLHATLEKKKLRDQLGQQLAVTRRVFGKFVPEYIAESILKGRGILEPSLSTATILYADIEGFTTIVDQMAPQEVMQMLNEYFSSLTRPLDRHKGTLTQFQGDAILVTFNVPAPDQSHADNAVQVAFEIQRTLRERTFAGNRLKTRIGIATGEVISGNVGSGDRINYTVQGQAVNLAARLEEANKELGTYTLLSEDTAAALTQDFPIKSLGNIEIRGIQNDVPVHQLTV